MASWEQLVDYVKKNYKVAVQTDRMLRFLFSINDRSQIVFVWYTPMQDGTNWVQIESPIGELDMLDLRKLLELVEKKIVGGVAAFEGYAVLREDAGYHNNLILRIRARVHRTGRRTPKKRTACFGTVSTS